MPTRKTARKRRPVVHDMIIAMRLPTELREQVEKLAAADRRSFSDYVRLLLENHVTHAKKRK